MKLGSGWVGSEISKHKKAFTSALLQDTSNLANSNNWILKKRILKIEVLDDATVEVPGVFISRPASFLIRDNCTQTGAKLFVYTGLMRLMYNHIGVGSDVVCSTSIGNARASMCGIDNSSIPRFFYAPTTGSV